MSITIKEIARIANVNPSTVSRSLNDSNLVSSETKQKIKKIAENLGFEFNSSARSLMTKKSNTIGIVYPPDYDSFDVFQYYMKVNNELIKRLGEQNMDLLVSVLENKETGKNNVKRLVKQQKLDGLMIADYNISKDTLSFLNKSRVPFVFFHEIINKETKDFDAFYTNHIEGGYMATKYLLESGCKKIISITSPGEQFSLRTTGYKKALIESGIDFKESMVFNGEQSFAKTSELVKNNIEIFKKSDGIFAQNDLMAFAVIETLKALNINIPKDISVIGYDDIEISNYITPKLTTIRQPIKEMSEAAYSRLLDLIQHKDMELGADINFVFTPKLIIRDSCRNK